MKLRSDPSSGRGKPRPPHDELVRRALKTHGGREIKHTGDGIMAAFDKTPDSVRAAAEVQRQLVAYNALTPEPLRVRIGIHAGEPVADHNDLFGATVQLANRLCNGAEGGSIVVSELVRGLCEEDAARFEPLGEWQLKGFAPNAAAAIECHRESHGEAGVPSAIIPVDLARQ